jgi:hypothetical protein
MHIYGTVRCVDIDPPPEKSLQFWALYSDNTAAKLAWLLPNLSVFNWLHITCI